MHSCLNCLPHSPDPGLAASEILPHCKNKVTEIKASFVIEIIANLGNDFIFYLFLFIHFANDDQNH